MESKYVYCVCVAIQHLVGIQIDMFDFINRKKLMQNSRKMQQAATGRH